MRTLYALTCKVCHSEYWRPKHRLESSGSCSISCRGKLRHNRDTIVCSGCGVTFHSRKSASVNSRSGLRFCTRACKDKSQRLEGLKDIQPSHYGTADICRDFLIRKRRLRCEHCGRSEWEDNPIPLEIHHIDGNRTNNEDANLELNCPNCHALTPNFKGRNKRHYGAVA